MNLEEQLRVAKLDRQSISIEDKEAFKAKIREKLLTKNAKPRLAVKRWVMVLAPIVCVPLAGWGYQALTASSITETTVEEGLRQVDFEVKQPTKLPFPVGHSWADVTSFPSHKNVAIAIVWDNNDDSRKAIEEFVAPTQFADEIQKLKLQHSQSVSLGNGLPAMYSSGDLGQLVWQQNGNTYVLRDVEGVGPGPKKPFLSMAELIGIADSMR